MTGKDKLEIGLKEDAPFRKDNLPESQVRGPQIPTGPGRSPEIPMARDDQNDVQPDLDADETSEAAATTEGMPPAPVDESDALGG